VLAALIAGLLAIVWTTLPVAAQSVDEQLEWSGELVWASDNVTQLGPATITITRTAGTDEFTATIVLGTIAERRFEPPTGRDPVICASERALVFEGSGTFALEATQLVLLGIETVELTYPACPVEVANDGEITTTERQLRVALGDDTLSGIWTYSQFSLPGPIPLPIGAAAGSDASDDDAGDGNGETAVANDSATENDEGSTGLLIGGVLVVVIAVGGAVVVSRARRRSRSGIANDGRSSEEPEKRERRVSLELTYPAGPSPKVFNDGWVFGARCTVEDDSGLHDYSGQVHWSFSGDGSGSPDVGAMCRPVWAGPGEKWIKLSVTVDGALVESTFPVVTVERLDYAGVGYLVARIPACSHGCDACPHDAKGPLVTGSPTVTVMGVPAGRVGDTGIHAACCGGNIWEVVEGDPEVLIDGRPAAKIGSKTKHCGGVGSIEYG
jgi:uncharacterized Zn-binding protein involved in type VI secretion